MAESSQRFRRTVTDAQTEVPNYICTPCSTNNTTLDAVGFCEDCSEFLCDECFRYHLRPKVARTHKLLTLEEVRNEHLDVRSQDLCTEECALHMRKITEYICLEHGTPGCSVCMTLYHKNCPPVTYIPDIAEDRIKSDEFANTIRELNATVLRTKCLIERSTELKSHKDCLKALDEVAKLKEEIIGVFETLETNIRTEIDDIIKRDAQRFDDNICSLEVIQIEARTLIDDLTTLRDNGQYCKAYVVMKTEHPSIKALDEKLDVLANDSFVAQYKFRPSKQLQELLKDGHSLGKLCQQDDHVKRKKTLVGEINVKTDGDNDICRITGLVSLVCGRLVALDYSNNKAKLVDVEQATVVSELDLCGNLLDITATNVKDEVVVTTASSKLLLLKIYGDRIEKYGEIPTSDKCYAVVSFTDKLIVSLKRPERLEIIDKLGNVLDKISNEMYGHDIFKDKRSVVVNQERGKIYIADKDKNAVCCISLSGKLKAVYTAKDLRYPSCLTVDHRGVVYVGDGDSHYVRQISANCQKIKTILSRKNGLDFPRSLCYDADTDCLFVGQYASNNILVFQLN